MVDFREPRPPGGGPKYAHASKERRGAAERKKNQERKSQESGKRHKRDLNTQAARGPANFWLPFSIKKVVDLSIDFSLIFGWIFGG